jgi:tetratricopeptide (TPR) repeat protein
MKRSAVNRVISTAVMAVLLTSGSCSMFRALGLAPPVFREDFSSLAPEEFSEKIKELEEISQSHKNKAVRARALYYIALAHLHYNNPSVDYSLALEYLDKYMALDPENKDKDEVVVWKSTLLALEVSLRECEKLERSYAQLKQEYERADASANENRAALNKQIKDLSNMIENQKKEIGNLQETIKKLDAVHREIEKKKRRIKK